MNHEQTRDGAPAATGRAESKGSQFRGYVATIERHGLLPQVLERVPPATRALVLDPPVASAWISADHSFEVGLAVAALVGPHGWRRIVHEATLTGLAPVLRLTVESFLRLFGASPASIFSRLGQLTASSVRGAEYEYAATSPRSGVLTFRQTARRDVPIAIFHGAAGGFEAAFDLCKVKGTIGDPELVDDGRGNAARYRVSW